MRLLTVADLTEYLWGAADILRGSIDASEYLEIVSGMLILKRASDQPGFLRVPDSARWSHIVVYSGRELGHVLDEALANWRTATQNCWLALWRAAISLGALALHSCKILLTISAIFRWTTIIWNSVM